jgi:hypothetical protein
MQRLVIVFFVSLVFLAACGGAGNGGASLSTPLAPITPYPAELLTPGPPPAIDPNTELVPYTSEGLPYTIAYPAGWEIAAGPYGGETFSYRTPEKGLVAQLIVGCGRTLGVGSIDPKDLVQEDAQLMKGANAPLESVKTDEITVDGRYAIRWLYALNYGSARINNWVVYTSDGTCGWRIRMVVYGQLPVDSYQQLFLRIVDTFHSTAGAPSGTGG